MQIKRKENVSSGRRNVLGVGGSSVWASVIGDVSIPVTCSSTFCPDGSGFLVFKEAETGEPRNLPPKSK
jgi:hypothetical protein